MGTIYLGFFGIRFCLGNIRGFGCILFNIIIGEKYLYLLIIHIMKDFFFMIRVY